MSVRINCLFWQTAGPPGLKLSRACESLTGTLKAVKHQGCGSPVPGTRPSGPTLSLSLHSCDAGCTSPASCRLPAPCRGGTFWAEPCLSASPWAGGPSATSPSRYFSAWRQDQALEEENSSVVTPVCITDLKDECWLVSPRKRPLPQRHAGPGKRLGDGAFGLSLRAPGSPSPSSSNYTFLNASDTASNHFLLSITDPAFLPQVGGSPPGPGSSPLPPPAPAPPPPWPPGRDLQGLAALQWETLALFSGRKQERVGEGP